MVNNENIITSVDMGEKFGIIDFRHCDFSIQVSDAELKRYNKEAREYKKEKAKYGPFWCYPSIAPKMIDKMGMYLLNDNLMSTFRFNVDNKEDFDKMSEENQRIFDYVHEKVKNYFAQIYRFWKAQKIRHNPKLDKNILVFVWPKDGNGQKIDSIFCFDEDNETLQSFNEGIVLYSDAVTDLTDIHEYKPYCIYHCGEISVAPDESEKKISDFLNSEKKGEPLKIVIVPYTEFDSVQDKKRRGAQATYNDSVLSIMTECAKYRKKLQQLNKKKRSSLAGLGDTIEEQKEKKMRTIALTAFKALNPISQFKEVKVKDLKVGDIIVDTIDNEARFVYAKVVKIDYSDSLDWYHYRCKIVRCDANGTEIKDSGYWSNKPSNLYRSDDVLVHITHGKEVKSKLIGQETIDGETFDIYSCADSEMQQYSGNPEFGINNAMYFLVMSDKKFGFVKVENKFYPPTLEDRLERKIRQMVIIRDTLAKYPGLTLGAWGASLSKNIKLVLKKEFPDTTFSVSSDSYRRLSVKYTDGPSKASVRNVIAPFEMIYENDNTSDYGDWTNTEFTQVWGGIKTIGYYRMISDNAKQRLYSLFPELKLERVDVNDLRKKHPDWIETIEKEYGLHVSPEKLEINNGSVTISADDILHSANLTVYKKPKAKKVQKTPTEKALYEAVGSANIIARAAFNDEYYLCKLPDIDDDYLSPLWYSQPTIYSKVKARFETIGLRTKWGNSGKMTFENYPEILEKISQERKQMGIPDVANQWAVMEFRVRRNNLDFHNKIKARDLKQNINEQK